MSDLGNLRLEPCVLRPGQKPGWIYFIACSETTRCKIGFTMGKPMARLRALQTGAPGKLRLIAQHPGTPESERSLHGRFSAQRLHGEWFEMSEEIFDYICLAVWTMGAICADGDLPIEPWLKSGLRMIRDHTGAALPDYLEKLIGVANDA